MHPYIYAPDDDKKSTFRGGGRILQILRENLSDSAKFVDDFSHINYDNALLIPSWQPFQPPRLYKRLAKKQILMIFDVIPLKYPAHFPAGIRGNLNLWRNKRALAHFDKIITISEHSKKDIVRYLNVPEKKVAVVYPSVSQIFLNPKLKARNHNQYQNTNLPNSKMFHGTRFMIHEKRFALYVGDVNWNKNLVNLARAIKIADIPCLFVGKPFLPEINHETGIVKHNDSGVKFQDSFSHPWQAEFKQFLKEVGDDKRFVFAGYVPDEDLISLYQNAICNILVSHDEGFGYSYAEAASQKCPSVLSDIDIFHETANDTALFADPNNPDDIAQKIKQLSSNEKLRNSLSEKAYNRVLKIFSPKVFKEYTLKSLV